MYRKRSVGGGGGTGGAQCNVRDILNSHTHKPKLCVFGVRSSTLFRFVNNNEIKPSIDGKLAAAQLA